MAVISSRRKTTFESGWELLKKREIRAILFVSLVAFLYTFHSIVTSPGVVFWADEIESSPLVQTATTAAVTTRTKTATAAPPVPLGNNKGEPKGTISESQRRTGDAAAAAAVNKKKEPRVRISEPKSSTIRNGNTWSTPSPPRLQALEKKFYQYHYDEMAKIPKSNMLIWEARDKWKSFWKHLKGNYYTVQKDTDLTAPPTADNPIPANTEKHPILYFHEYIGLCQAAKLFEKFHKQFPQASFPHIAVVRLQEDMGGLSESIDGVTTPRYYLTQRWKREGGCKKNFILEYIDHPDTLAVITSQHQIIDHPKAHSLPLGLRFAYTGESAYKQIHHNYNINATTTNTKRPKLMMVNSRTKDRANRAMIQAKVLRKFRPLGIRNTFGNPTKVDGYFSEMLESTFIFSPAGAGWDCYRNWEALCMGTIPIIEHKNRKDGWYRTFDDLPVAWIDDFLNLTPEWLEQKYEEILARPESYRWDKLTQSYWIEFVWSILRNANIEIKPVVF